MESDSQLVGRVRRGDVEAFGQLAERYERNLLALALGKLHDVHEAEDVVQTTLLMAFRKFETLRDDGKFVAWLMQIARRQLVDAVRARPIAATIPAHDLERAANDNARTEFIVNESLLNLVARLPEPEGQLVGLRYFDGYSMSEIAEITARPLGTVTKQLSRAIARLRAWYEKESA